jgi:hypothetical protein
MPSPFYRKSEIGHGERGMRSNLQPRQELYETTAYEKHVFVDARPTFDLNSWTVESGNCYRASTSTLSFDGVQLDVVRVRYEGGWLTRVQTLALCVSTSGTYFFDPDDITTLRCYVNLGGTNPNTQNVVIALGVYVSNIPANEPSFGADLLTDGAFEVWGRGPELTSWVESQTGTGTSFAQTVPPEVWSGAFALRLTATSSSTLGATTQVLQNTASACVPGKTYWLEGYYKTDAFQTGLTAGVAVGDNTSNLYVGDDGRTPVSGVTIVPLTNTQGKWRRFSFCFVYPEAGTGNLSVILRMTVDTAASAGGVVFDVCKLRRVWRFNYYYPWLPPGGCPALNVGRPDAYFGEWQIGLGSMKWLQQDRKLDTLISQLNWPGSELVVRQGGRFPSSVGDEVLFDDAGFRYVGIVDRADVNDQEANLALRDQRELLKLELPLDSYNQASLVNLEPRFVGRPRQLIFGLVSNLTPTKVDNSSTGLPIYEVAANADLSSGTPIVRVFIDEDAAKRRDTTRAVQLVSAEWDSPAAGRVRLLEHPGVIEILAGVNDALDLVVGGVTREVFLTPGLYKMTANGNVSTGLIPQVESKLDALPDPDFTVSISTSTWKVTIATAAASLTLLQDTGVNRHRSAYKTLGFTSATDTAGVSQVGDTALYDSTKVNAFVVRMDNVRGPSDDGSGTYTGTPSALIEKAPDIAYYLLRAVLLFDPSLIDVASVAACRAGAPDALSVCIGGLAGTQSGSRERLATIFSRLEAGAGMDILLKLNTWYMQIRDDVPPSDIVDLYDRDFLLNSYSAWLETADVFYSLRLKYAQDPSEGTWREEQVFPGGTYFVPFNHGTWEEKVFETYLTDGVAAANRVNVLAAVALQPVRHFTFKVRGKAYELIPGGKIRSNRTRGLKDPAGTNDPVVMRVLSKQDDSEGHESTIVAMTDIG